MIGASSDSKSAGAAGGAAGVGIVDASIAARDEGGGHQRPAESRMRFSRKWFPRDGDAGWMEEAAPRGGGQGCRAAAEGSARGARPPPARTPRPPPPKKHWGG